MCVYIYIYIYIYTAYTHKNSLSLSDHISCDFNLQTSGRGYKKFAFIISFFLECLILFMH